MNRTGLAIALAVAAVVGVVFGVYPQFDLAVSALFFDANKRTFAMGGQAWTLYSRDIASALITLLVAPAFVAIVGKHKMPRRRMLIGGRAALLLIVTLALGPGVLANKIFKEHWGRMRPVDVTQFGGTDGFMAAGSDPSSSAGNRRLPPGARRKGRHRRRKRSAPRSSSPAAAPRSPIP